MSTLTLCIRMNNYVESDEWNGGYWVCYAPSFNDHETERRLSFMVQDSIFRKQVNACATLIDLPFHKAMNPLSTGQFSIFYFLRSAGSVSHIRMSAPLFPEEIAEYQTPIRVKYQFRTIIDDNWYYFWYIRHKIVLRDADCLPTKIKIRALNYWMHGTSLLLGRMLYRELQNARRRRTASSTRQK